MLLPTIPRLFFALLAAALWMTGPVAAQDAKGWTASAGMIPTGEDPSVRMPSFPMSITSRTAPIPRPAR